ncbi:MAG TPA: phosphate ABC transporter permease subunit PstC [Spirochaetaceae bacterium]|jgi:phosphate transport system permease protein|nr:phosphate ABC transporter permease subunit PstC [Spirochaetaceae bacterium]
MNDKRFNVLLGFAAMVVVFIFAGFLFTLVVQSLPAVKQEGAAFLYGSEWNPVTTRFGALPFIIGTLMTSAIALAIAIPLSLSAGIVMGEYVNSLWLRSVLNTLINVLASIPSVVFGLWGIEVVIPLVRSLAMSVGAPPYGAGILSASLVLAIMIIPYMSSMTREALVNVHAGLREGAYALGLTKQEVVTGIALPFAKNSIFAGILLSLGRALGETMAVTMLIGNATRIPTSLFSLGNTLASVIASQFNEAASDVHRSAMMGLALILFVITMIIGWFGRTLMRKGVGAHGE